MADTAWVCVCAFSQHWFSLPQPEGPILIFYILTQAFFHLCFWALFLPSSLLLLTSCSAEWKLTCCEQMCTSTILVCMSRETTVVVSLESIHPSVHGILILFWEIFVPPVSVHIVWMELTLCSLPTHCSDLANLIRLHGTATDSQVNMWHKWVQEGFAYKLWLEILGNFQSFKKYWPFLAAGGG